MRGASDAAKFHGGPKETAFYLSFRLHCIRHAPRHAPAIIMDDIHLSYLYPDYAVITSKYAF